MTSDHLSLEQAERLTGRSRRTIQRHYRELRKQDPEAAERIIKFHISEKGRRQKLFSRDWLLSNFPSSQKGGKEEKENPEGRAGHEEKGPDSGERKERGSSGGEDPSLLHILRRELEEKNAQIRAKDEQLEELLQRTRELHILFSRIQEQLNQLDIQRGQVSYAERDRTGGSSDDIDRDFTDDKHEKRKDDTGHDTTKNDRDEGKEGPSGEKRKPRSFSDWL